jgi:DNA-binding transcriptional LysR family regulator
MNLLYLAAFRAVMLSGTVSAAAEILGRSQPAVSRLLDRLEEELGVSLFERRRGLVAPTRAAQLLLDEIERAYVSLDNLKSFATRVAEGESSRVAIAVMPALGITFVPQLLAKFREDWAHTRVILNVRLSNKIEEWAAAQQIDFGLAEVPFKRTGFRSEIFSDSPYIAAVPRDHALASKSCLGPADLLDGPFISWTSFVAAGPLIAQAFRSTGVVLDAVCEVTFSASAYEMVKQGMGAALVDPYTALKQYDDRVRLIPFVPTIPFNVALLRPDLRPASRAVDALLDLLATERDRLMVALPC